MKELQLVVLPGHVACLTPLKHLPDFASPTALGHIRGQEEDCSVFEVTLGQPIRYTQGAGNSVKLNHSSDTDRAEIHSPTPKRHFLLQTESSDLLNSRPDTPFSTISTSSHVDSFSSSSPQRPLLRQQTLSFSSLHANETKQSSPSKAERPATRLRLPSASYVREANESSLGRRWVKWMHRNRLDNHILLCMVSVAVLIKWFVGLSGYSGEFRAMPSRDPGDMSDGILQAKERLPILGTLRLRDTGWKSVNTCRSNSGIPTTMRTGGSTILLLLPIIHGCVG